MDALLELQSCAHRLARAYYLRGYCAVAAHINNKLGVDFMNPHRLQPLRHDRFPLAGFKQHRCYINDGPVKPNITMPSVQSESDVLAAVRNEFGIDHYNPRHVPALASYEMILGLSWVVPPQDYAWDGSPRPSNVFGLELRHD